MSRPFKAMTAAVTTKAARTASHMRAKNWPSVMRRCSRTIRFVRFELGRNSDPALDKRMHA